MDDNEKITLSQWNELTVHKNELLRQWSIQNRYELDIVPGISGSFDPSCEYAALLTKAQIIQFLYSNLLLKAVNNQEIDSLWDSLKESIEIENKKLLKGGGKYNGSKTLL